MKTGNRNHPIANRSDVFVLCPYNDQISAAAAHDRAGRCRLQILVRLHSSIEQLILDQLHATIDVEHVWFELRCAHPDLELRILRIGGVKQN